MGLPRGRSLLPLLRGDEPDSLDPRENPTRAFACSGLHGQAWSIRSQEWTYLQHLRAGRKAGSERQRYDRTLDQGPEGFRVAESATAGKAMFQLD